MKYFRTHSLLVTIFTFVSSCSAPPAPPTENLRPVAETGPDQTVIIRSLVSIDGANSSDPDEGPNSLSFSWKPSESNPTEVVVSMTGPQFQFTPIKTGNYVFILTVSDGQIKSIPDSIVVTVVSENNVHIIIAQSTPSKFFSTL